MNENLQNQNDDMIDLREIFKMFYNERKFILIFSLVFAVLGLLYSLSKTPVYEARALIEMGTFGDKPIENSSLMRDRVSYAFKAFEDMISGEDLKNGAIYKVELIEPDKGKKKTAKDTTIDPDDKKVEQNFLKITARGFDREKLADKTKEVLEFVKNEEQTKIEKEKLLKNISIKDTEYKIKYNNEVNASLVKEKIKIIKEQKIPNIDDKIKLLNSSIADTQNQINQNEQNLATYLQSLKTSNKVDPNLLVMLNSNISNTQNFITSLKDKILDIQNKLITLEQQKNDLTTMATHLETDLNVVLPKRTADLQNNLVRTKFYLDKEVKFAKFAGGVSVGNKNIGKGMIIIVPIAFGVGLILALIIAPFRQMVKSIKAEKNKGEI
ncbi:MAG: hypothetical protein K5978_00320 [Campylobacter sp.]|nr:hypothetical protein [Campylobacter sp.]